MRPLLTPILAVAISVACTRDVDVDAITALVPLDGATCALYGSGEVHCGVDSGPATYAPPQGTFGDLDGTGSRVCAVDLDGTPVCWGSSTVPEGWADRSMVRIALSRAPTFNDHDCGIDTKGRAACWQGDGAPHPSVDLDLADAVDVAASRQVGCAVAMDGALTCAGMDWTATDVVDIAGSRAEMCALFEDGRSECRQLGGETFSPEEPLRSVAGGSTGMCGVLEAGGVTCWTTQGTTYVGDVPDAVVVTGWAERACAADADGVVECWGFSNMRGVFLDNADTCDDWIQPLGIYLVASGDSQMCLEAAGCGVSCGDEIVGIPHTDDLRARFTADGAFAVNIRTTGERFASMDRSAEFFVMTQRQEMLDPAADIGLEHDPSRGFVVVNARSKGTVVALEGGPDPIYGGLDGYDLDASATTEAGGALFFDVEPGAQSISASRGGAPCRPRLARPGSEPGTFVADVVADEVTFVSLDCG